MFFNTLLVFASFVTFMAGWINDSALLVSMSNYILIAATASAILTEIKKGRD